MALQSGVGVGVQEATMSKVSAFHSDNSSPKYHPRERYVYHDDSECGYGKEVKRDGHAIAGVGTDPEGKARTHCDSCKG
jgi:hypothetical protein